MFGRVIISQEGLQRVARAGDGILDKPIITTNAAAGNQSITVAGIMGGCCVFTGAAGAVTYQMPTAADLLAAMPEADIGDTYVFTITNTAAQAATLNNAATGVTFAGFTTANAQTRTGIIEKTSSTTVKCTFI